MTQYNIVSAASMVAGQPEDISIVLANLQAIASVLNGQLDNGNLAAGAAIDKTKLAALGIVNSDIDPLAAIAVSKIAPGTVGQVLTTGAGPTPVWGAAAAPGPVILDRKPGDITVANTVTETPIYSFSVPGGTLGTDKCLRLTIVGMYTYAAGNNLTLRFKYGATTWSAITSLTATNVNAAAKPWRILAWLFAEGATNAQRGMVDCFGGEAEMAADRGSFEHAEAFQAWGGGSPGVAAEDSTQAKDLVVTAQWSAASASLSWQTKHAFLELV